jgi:hypothetical protein
MHGPYDELPDSHSSSCDCWSCLPVPTNRSSTQDSPHCSSQTVDIDRLCRKIDDLVDELRKARLGDQK